MHWERSKYRQHALCWMCAAASASLCKLGNAPSSPSWSRGRTKCTASKGTAHQQRIFQPESCKGRIRSQDLYLRPALVAVWRLQEMVCHEVTGLLKSASAAQTAHFICHSAIWSASSILLLMCLSPVQGLLHSSFLLVWVEDGHQLERTGQNAKADNIPCMTQQAGGNSAANNCPTGLG